MKKVVLVAGASLFLMSLAIGVNAGEWYDGGFGNGKFVDWLTTGVAEWWVGG